MADQQPKLRPIKRQDIVDMYGENLSVSVRGWAAVLDGEVIGIAGVAFSKPLQCFSFLDERMKDYPRKIIEAVKLVRELLASISLPVYATPDEDEKDTADTFLKHVGFVVLHRGVYRWHG